MDDELVKTALQEELTRVRAALAWELDGLSEYDVRRPLTVTGTNLLGLVKHCATWEGWYLGAIFDRPFSGELLSWEDADGSDQWARADESREEVLDFYRRVAAHSDATIRALPLDAPGRVPWWSRPDVRLYDILLHVLGDTTRHAGHADILREQLDGRTGVSANQEEPNDAESRAARVAMIEDAARAAGRR